MSVVNTPDAPAAIGPYSQARMAGGLVFASGQLPIDPATGKLVEGDTVAQLRQCLANVEAIAKAAGGNLGSVVKVTLLMTDLSQFASVNAEYSKIFQAPFPARTTFQVAALPMGAAIEVEAVIEP